MKIPRNLGGEEFAKLLKKYGYQETRQTGSHMRLTTTLEGKHHITIPHHKPLKVGTLNNILNDVSAHLKIPKEIMLKKLFG
ncbi:MAG: type II toxin-antitoxin system HicA family toxin [Actinobacteria bacterium]|nr:type II toxin-antitoxin system HicA family toxin [Actinomycetota bacterium]